VINIIGTLNVLEAARENGCGVIFSSSGAVYGNNFQYPQPISPYGISKITAERYMNMYHDLYGLRTIVFRFSSIYGKERKKTSINLILDKALKNETIQINGDGQQTRDFTHVSDIAEAVLLAVQDKMPSGTYDIGTGTSTSINELVTLIGNLLNKPLKVEHVTSTVIGDPKRNELNVSKAAIYGFQAKVHLFEGVKQLIEDLK
jgi:UDP-glucose 4-epimerase